MINVELTLQQALLVRYALMVTSVERKDTIKDTDFNEEVITELFSRIGDSILAAR